MIDESSRLTPDLLWRATAVALLIDIPLVSLVNHLVPSALFRRLKWYLAVAAFLLYVVLWAGFASPYFWDSVYQAVFPGWSRWLLPPWFGVMYGLLGLLFWRMASAASQREVVWFVCLGGVVSLVGHGIGIARGLLRVPLLSEASPVSALVFGVFEFIFYWCVIVAVAAAGRRMITRVRANDA